MAVETSVDTNWIRSKLRRWAWTTSSTDLTKHILVITHSCIFWIEDIRRKSVVSVMLQPPFAGKRAPRYLGPHACIIPTFVLDGVLQYYEFSTWDLSDYTCILYNRSYINQDYLSSMSFWCYIFNTVKNYLPDIRDDGIPVKPPSFRPSLWENYNSWTNTICATTKIYWKNPFHDFEVAALSAVRRCSRQKRKWRLLNSECRLPEWGR